MLVPYASADSHIIRSRLILVWTAGLEAILRCLQSVK